MAQKPRSIERPRRFYKLADTGPAEAGFAVRLDGRIPKSPGGRQLILPTAGLARVIAAEWEAQGEFVVVPDMPATRLAHTALDLVGATRDAVAGELARFAAADAICYFAAYPDALKKRQEEAWRPLLAKAAELGVALTPTTGVIHVEQPAASLARAQALAAEQDDFTLAGLAFAAALYGSSVLAFMVALGHLGAESAFDLSRLDETFQEEQWGVDSEAAARTALLRADAVMLEAWFEGLRVP